MSNALIAACKRGDLKAIETRLQQGDNVNDVSTETTALFEACKNGQLEVVKRLLLVDGIDVNIALQPGASPLYIACYCNFPEVVEVLLQHPNIDTQTPDPNNDSLALAVCKQGFSKILTLLLKRGDVDINHTNEKNETLLHAACALPTDKIAAKLLLLHPEIDVNVVNSDNLTPFLIAWAGGHTILVKQLARIPNINLYHNERYLMETMHCHYMTKKYDRVNAMFEILGLTHDTLMSPPHPDDSFILTQARNFRFCTPQNIMNAAADARKESPLWRACVHEDAEAVARYLKSNPELINEPDCKGRTPLYMCCSYRDTRALEMILKCPGVSVDQPTLDGETPLFIAAYYHNPCIELLINAGANVNLPTNSGFTPLHLCCLGSWEFGVRKLLEHPNININARTETGKTPLVTACMQRAGNVISILLSQPKILVDESVVKYINFANAGEILFAPPISRKLLQLSFDFSLVPEQILNKYEDYVEQARTEHILEHYRKVADD